MALDQSALLELTEALRSADGGDLTRTLLRTMMQALVGAFGPGVVHIRPVRCLVARFRLPSGWCR